LRDGAAALSGWLPVSALRTVEPAGAQRRRGSGGLSLRVGKATVTLVREQERCAWVVLGWNWSAMSLFVLTRSGERIAVRCDCPLGADHVFERPLGARPGDGLPND
jgi:hypothetical protein